MYQHKTRSFMAATLVVALLLPMHLAMAQKIYTPQADYEREDSRTDSTSAPEMLLDMFFLRPIGFAATVVGAVAFVISLPFSLPTKSADRAAETLVKAPARYTFTRPLGKI